MHPRRYSVNAGARAARAHTSSSTPTTTTVKFAAPVVVVGATFFCEYSQNPVSSEYFFPTGFGSIKCISRGIRTEIFRAFPNRKGFTSYISFPKGVATVYTVAETVKCDTHTTLA